MINKDMIKLGEEKSKIRELFEYGKVLAEKEGKENVFDFTLGNPSVPCPESVKAELLSIIENKSDVHAYTSAQGDKNTRTAISLYNYKKYGYSLDPDLIYMTCGAAAAIRIVLSSLICKNTDEVVVFAPFFPEYKVFIESAGAKIVIVPPKNDMGIDLTALKNALNENTRAVIVNSPNNPSGKVYTENEIIELSEELYAAEKKFGNPIYLIADEPYREIVFNGAVCPFIPAFYKNTVICYSYSKALSLPGERIGYVAVSPEAAKANDLYLAVAGAGRSLGYVCAPSLFQHLIAKCADKVSDIEPYRENRDILIKMLKKYNFSCINPDGAFYLFVKSPIPSAEEFSEKAKRFNLLIVPSESFGVDGYVRIATCVDKNTVVNSEKAFKNLAESVGLI